MSFERFQIHNNDVKKLLYLKEKDMLVSCSLDGKMKHLNQSNMLESEEILGMESLVGVVECSDGLVVAAQDGVIVHMTYEGGVRQLKIKCTARPSAITCQENTLVLGDWEGNLYQYNLSNDQIQIYSFGKFKYEDRVVVNGVYALCIHCGTIYAGLSSGDIAVGTGNKFQLFSMHKKAVRSIQVVDDNTLVSAGNDGRVVLFNTKNQLWREIQSNYQNQELIFAAYVIKTAKLSQSGENQTFVAFGGTAPIIEVVNVDNLEDRFFLPIVGDVWTITIVENSNGLILYTGGQAGLVVQFYLEQIVSKQEQAANFNTQNIKTPYEDDCAIADFKLKQDHFTGGSNKILPMQELKAKYNFASLDQIKGKLNATSRLFVCFYKDAPHLFAFYRNQLILLAELETPEEGEEQQQLNPKDGKYYDQSVIVDIEGQNKVRLYLNKNENPEVVAIRFLTENGLPTDFDTKKQIQDHIQQSVKISNLENWYKIDCDQVFKSASGNINNVGRVINSEQDSQTQLNKLIENLDINLQTIITTQPNETSQSIAEKAFGLISSQFDGCELTDVCQLFDFTIEQMKNVFNITDNNRKAFLALMCYAIQTGENPANDVSNEFISFLINIIITSESEAEITFTSRLLCLLLKQSKYIDIIDQEINKNAIQVITKIANIHTNDSYALLAWVGRKGIKRYLGEDAEMIANIIYQNLLQ